MKTKRVSIKFSACWSGRRDCTTRAEKQDGEHEPNKEDDVHDNEAEDALLLEQEDQDDSDAEEITKEASRAWKKKFASLSRKE